MPRVLVLTTDESLATTLSADVRAAAREAVLTMVTSLDAAVMELRRGRVDVAIIDARHDPSHASDLPSVNRSPVRPGAAAIILIAPSDGLGDLESAIEDGVLDVLRPPYDSSTLRNRVRSAIRLKSVADELHARRASLEEAVAKRTLELESARLEVIFRLAMLAEYRDARTGYHVVRVGRYAWLTGRELGLETAERDQLLLAAPLHDIGKINVPDGVLLKPGSLDQREWDIMQGHCRAGYEILTGRGAMEAALREGFALVTGLPEDLPPNPLLEMAGEIALTHHERWDGTGYPSGLAGDAIPLAGRITAVADAFDALTSERSYKTAGSTESALELLEEGAGQHFDPDVVAAFRSVVDEIEQVREQLSDERLGTGRMAG